MMSTNDEFVVATRIHLGKQSTPPPHSRLVITLESFTNTACEICASKAVVAVDPEEKIEGYDLFEAIIGALDEVMRKDSKQEKLEIEVIKVTPWSNFIPALNALVTNACAKRLKGGAYAKTILFISAETTFTKDSMNSLSKHMDFRDTLVVGAALPGHDYVEGEGTEGTVVDLNGRTCPWNTLCMWNLSKLKLGFPLVGDGIHKNDDGSAIAGGIEEFSTIIIHQKLLGIETSKVKLVKVPGIEWDQSFEDEERKKWHEAKMKSKTSRAETHRELLGGLKGVVIHL